jgi:hypothetical protein
MEEAAALAFLRYVLTPSIITRNKNIPRIERINPVMAQPLARALRLATPMIEKIRPNVEKRAPTPGNQKKHIERIPITRPATAKPLLRVVGTGGAI